VLEGREKDLHKDVCSSEKLTAMLKQEASTFVALLLRSTIHRGLYRVTNIRGTASPGAWSVGVASSVGVAARRAREIERPTSRNLVGVVLELSADAGLVEVSSTLGVIFAAKLLFITSDKH
jgi:hypothetical protein